MDLLLIIIWGFCIWCVFNILCGLIGGILGNIAGNLAKNKSKKIT